MWEAIQEFGWDNIQHIILESDVPEEEVSRKERQYIDQYDSANSEKGYNRQRGGLSGESSYYDEDQIIELYEDGWTLAAIAKQVGCCARTASDVLHKYGIPDAELVQRGREAIKGTGKLMDDWDTFYDLFQNQNKSLVEISKITGWSYGAARLTILGLLGHTRGLSLVFTLKIGQKAICGIGIKSTLVRKSKLVLVVVSKNGVAIII